MGKKMAGRVAGMIACAVLALPAVTWAGSAQASLAVNAVVPARCALRVAGDSVVMKCTKGSLPSGGRGVISRASAVEPRITRDVVFAAAPVGPSAPLPLTESGPGAPAGAAVRQVVTVNF